MGYEKAVITKFVEKYYLNGLINGAQIVSKDGNLQTLFRNVDGNFRGEVVLEDINLPEGEIGMYYTKKLLNLMTILDDTIDVEYKGIRPEDNSVVAIEMKDKKGKKITHAAAMLELVDYDGKRGTLKSVDVKIKLNQETIQDILKAFSAIGLPLDSQTLTFLKKGDDLYAVFGYSDSNADMIEIKLDAEVSDDYDETLSFPASVIKEVFTVNGKVFDNAVLEISMKGIMRLFFEEYKVKAEYWLRKSN